MEEKRFLEEDFSDFLAELVEGERLNESKEYGIAKLAIDGGYATFLKSKNTYLKIVSKTSYMMIV